MVGDTLSLSSSQNFWSQDPLTVLKIIEDLNEFLHVIDIGFYLLILILLY